MALKYTEDQVENILNKVSLDGTNFNKVFNNQPSDDGEYVLDKDGFKKKFNLIFSNNLLDNSNFKNMVDQYGKISTQIKTISKNTYFIDRWKTSEEEEVDIKTTEAGLLSINKAIKQILPEEISNKVENNLNNVILVAKNAEKDDITIYKYNSEKGFYFIQGDKIDNEPKITLSYSFNEHSFDIVPNGSLLLEYAALYICNDSSKVVSKEDIPIYIPKSYAEELAVCKRYFRHPYTVEAIENIIEKDNLFGKVTVAGTSTTKNARIAITYDQARKAYSHFFASSYIDDLRLENPTINCDSDKIPDETIISLLKQLKLKIKFEGASSEASAEWSFASQNDSNKQIIYAPSANTAANVNTNWFCTLITSGGSQIIQINKDYKNIYNFSAEI